MALYRHFADKDALLCALAEDGLTAWGEIALSLPGREPTEWLEALGEAFLQFALMQAHRFDVTFPSMMMVPIDQAKSVERLVDRPVLEIAFAVSALCQGLLSMYRAGRFSSEKQFKALYRSAVRRHLDSYARDLPWTGHAPSHA
jgi:AcrR family transcriptional regulator